MENPYAAGSYVPTAEEVGTGIDPDFLITASMGKRFGNLILDGICLQCFSYAYFFGYGMLYGFLAETAPSVAAALEAVFQVTLWPMLFGGHYILYYILFESLLQRTPAKYLTGTIVVNEEGARPSTLQIIGRSFARIIPFEALSILFSDELKAWHDSMSGTKVVQVGSIVP